MNLPPPPDRPQPAGKGSGIRDGLGEEERRVLRRTVRVDRAKTWGLVIAVSALVIGAVVAASLAGEYDRFSVLLLVGIGAVGAWMARRARSVAGSGPSGDGVSDAGVGSGSDTSRARFLNIAFSTRLPTWRGWSRDVGTLHITPKQVTLQGLKATLVIEAPFTATVEQTKYFYWPLVKVTGPPGPGQAAEAYLAVRGAPRSKFSASVTEMSQETNAVCDAINASRENS